eukprot:408383_1
MEGLEEKEQIQDLRMIITSEALDNKEDDILKINCLCCIDLMNTLSMEERAIKLVCGFIRENTKKSVTTIPSDVYRECIKFVGSAKDFEGKLLQSASERRRAKCREILMTLLTGQEFKCENKISLFYCQCLRKEIPKHSVNASIRRSIDTYLYSYIISYFILLIYMILIYNTSDQNYISIIIILSILGFIGLISFHTFKINRLYSAFRGCAFAFNKWTIRFYIMSAIIIATFIWIAIPILIMNMHTMDQIILFIIIIIAFFIKMIFDLLLIWAFIKRLLQLLRSNGYRSTASYAPRDLSLINLIGKEVLLSGIAIICYDILIPLVIIFSLLSEEFSFLLAILLVIMFSIIEMLTVVLLFTINKKWYDMLCGTCQRGCNWCCLKVV